MIKLAFLIAALFSLKVSAAEPTTPHGWIKTQAFKPVVFSAAVVATDEEMNLGSHLSVQVHELKGKVAKLYEQIKGQQAEIGAYKIKQKQKINEACYQLTFIDSIERQTWCFGKSKASVLAEAGPVLASEEFYKQLVLYAKEQIL